jgi:tetratricopeptide (TPR) repeat protein
MPSGDVPDRIGAIVDLDAASQSEGLVYGPRLLAEPPSRWRRLMRNEPHYRSFGTLRFLLLAARERFETQPSVAREITSAVLDFMDEVSAPSRLHKIGLRGLAWKEHANALEYAGDVRDALRAAERSIAIYGESPGLRFDQTRAKLVACNIYRDLKQPERALQLARECAAIFADYANSAERMMASLCEANVLFSLKRFPEALAIYSNIVEQAERNGDVLTLARALQNTAECAREMGDLEAARELYPRALARFNELDLATEAARVRWGFGLCLAAQGKARAAMSELYQVRGFFLHLGMNTAAAMVGLDVVRIKFDSDEDVQHLCAELVSTFTKAGFTQNAIEALAYLREQAREGLIDSQKIQRVRTYFSELSRKPTLHFARPINEEEAP